MKARPILFSGEMVRALLDGRKTQTRRVVKYETAMHGGILDFYDKLKRWVGALFVKNMQGNALSLCPYGQPGDLLWVRETFFRFSCIHANRDEIYYRADGETVNATMSGGWKPSIYMPRWASRLTLRITDVRVERLQDISEADAKSEGIAPCGISVRSGKPVTWFDYLDRTGAGLESPKASFESLWQSINGHESWEANPFVWVVQFEVIQANVDQVLERDAA